MSDGCPAEQVLHAWYSQTAVDDGLGYSIYLSTDGSEVKVTFVCAFAGDVEEYRWPDKVYVGKVVKHLSTNEGRYEDSYIDRKYH